MIFYQSGEISPNLFILLNRSRTPLDWSILFLCSEERCLNITIRFATIDALRIKIVILKIRYLSKCWIRKFLLNRTIPSHFFLYIRLFDTILIQLKVKKFLMTAFKPRISGLRSYRYTNCATTTALDKVVFVTQFTYNYLRSLSNCDPLTTTRAGLWMWLLGIIQSQCHLENLYLDTNIVSESYYRYTSVFVLSAYETRLYITYER